MRCIKSGIARCGMVVAAMALVKSCLVILELGKW